MHAAVFDTNTGDWSRKEWQTPLTPGPEVGLQYLCDLQDDEEDAPPVGPIRFSGDTERFIIVAAWTLGRQWFKLLIILSAAKVSDEECERLLQEHLPDEGADEDEE